MFAVRQCFFYNRYLEAVNLNYRHPNYFLPCLSMCCLFLFIFFSCIYVSLLLLIGDYALCKLFYSTSRFHVMRIFSPNITVIVFVTCASVENSFICVCLIVWNLFFFRKNVLLHQTKLRNDDLDFVNSNQNINYQILFFFNNAYTYIWVLPKKIPLISYTRY